ncbi:MAG: hypothetical protein PHP95_04185 [Desulfuromonadaceae bacterium]|nr:hypothetical protein [Desulfuromonadaceae bacterium]MDD2847635.1 hypothetical protein [Desulfuromonadaceae bacterium]MDD4131119.1 hypothetical protein [Desulfuromonadaceae bacterium]
MSQATPNQAVSPQSPATSTIETASNIAFSFGAKPTVAEIKAMVQHAVDAALASSAFTGDIKVVNKALEALAIPDPDARFRKQFSDVARRNLLAKAPEDENGNIRKPSDAAINAEVDRLLTALKAKKAKA